VSQWTWSQGCKRDTNGGVFPGCDDNIVVHAEWLPTDIDHHVRTAPQATAQL